MISKESCIKSYDNTGCSFLKCIHVFKKKAGGRCGDLIVSSIFKIKSRKRSRRVNRGEVYRALVVLTRYRTRRRFGFYFHSEGNFAVILSKKLRAKNLPLGTRILGSLPYELKGLGFSRLLVLAPNSF